MRIEGVGLEVSVLGRDGGGLVRIGSHLMMDMGSIRIFGVNRKGLTSI